MLISSIHRRYFNYEIILNVRSQISQNFNNYFVSFEVLQRLVTTVRDRFNQR